MLIPVRCFTCGKPVSAVWEKYKERIERGEQPGKVLDDLGMDRYCCRATFIGHIDLAKDAAAFKKF